jgi:hypothetical protein
MDSDQGLRLGGSRVECARDFMCFNKRTIRKTDQRPIRDLSETLAHECALASAPVSALASALY